MAIGDGDGRSWSGGRDRARANSARQRAAPSGTGGSERGNSLFSSFTLTREAIILPWERPYEAANSARLPFSAPALVRPGMMHTAPMRRPMTAQGRGPGMAPLDTASASSSTAAGPGLEAAVAGSTCRCAERSLSLRLSLGLGLSLSLSPSPSSSLTQP